MKNTTVFDYIEWRGDLPLRRDPFNEVDNLIFSMLAYLNYAGLAESEVPVALPAVAEKLVLPKSELKHGFLSRETLLELLRCCAASERFRDTRLCCFENVVDERQETQFSAVTFLLPDGNVFFSFRGTDSTLVGWKEDCMMSFMEAVPAQKSALRYVQEGALRHPGGLLLGGHSKGGNLAVWAAVHAPKPVQERILHAYSNDGPGFSDAMLHSEEYAAVLPRLSTFIPQSSIVGMLLEQGPYSTIRSHQAAVLQHDPLSWDISGAHFVYLKERSGFGKASDAALRNWLSAMSAEERMAFVDTLFRILSTPDAHNMRDLSEPKNLAAMFRTARELDEPTRRRFLELLLPGGEERKGGAL